MEIVLIFDHISKFSHIADTLIHYDYCWGDGKAILEHYPRLERKFKEHRIVGISVNPVTRKIVMGSAEFFRAQVEQFPIQIEVR